MTLEKDGFKYPHIDNKKCIECGFCKKVCPVLNPKIEEKELPDTYACINKNEKIRMESSSGGVFSLFAEYVLNKNGIIYGAAFNDKLEVQHIKVEKNEDLKYLRGSKYLQSDIVETFKEAKKVGFTDIICTPHYMEDYYEVPCEEISSKISQIRDLAEGINIKIHQGNEIYANENIMEYIKSGQATSLNGSRYVLIEFPMQTKPINMDQVIYLLLQAGKVPIVAHPERYSYVRENPNMLLEYIEQGVLFQTNYGSIIGMYGNEIKETAKKLLTHNMIHFLGSDNHRVNTVYKNIPEALKTLEKLVGEDKVQELTTENPECILNNEEIEIDEPIELKKNLFGNWK